ncbi:glycerophosphodiester phosphodiesterase family protein [Microbacterium imperiale]|uniref:Glycerophosphoryl diester phosphodiesterase n=1 Tax=Microbacterium imperiale TaxID=33884 RepID=A0A9W6HFW8_9MICO|nr:glycerophosphodiester phosphodiesterase family protein [Microbacterium imperiale]MBP2419404.1 glycerophosphoryl diester phosphodiesterase [Microbacterium imperiale]MDS0198726.1 glycerophosphodiester phosphodiesterase [Microbacterium imperiale]BFE39746.1 glycerophosphodiester phosphodiesterase [Microbacterium imperiale]GLJ79278.1 glycerophosphoryl diester phosphodiesterase [Microbacterium imperiale]
MTHPFFAPDRPRVFAHRGFVPPDAEGVVENSFAAFAAAHAAGVPYVESDCHVSADGTVILFHDADLARVAGDHRSVSDVGDRELELLMAERGGLVTLAQALEAFPTLRFNLDVKAEGAAEEVGRIVAPHADRVLLTSFSERRRVSAMRSASRLGGRPATSAGTTRVAAFVAAATVGVPWLIRRALRGIDAIQVPERRGPIRVVSPRLIRAAHRAGVEVHVWTVNDADDMRRLLAAGVDGLVTDRVDRALAVINGSR